MLVNLFGNLILVWPLGHVGIALSTAVAAWVNAIALWVVLRHRGHFTIDARLRRTLPRLFGAAAVMVAVLLGLGPVLSPYAGGALMQRIVCLGLLLGGGGAAYLVAARALRIFTLAELKSQFSRKGTAK